VQCANSNQFYYVVNYTKQMFPLYGLISQLLPDDLDISSDDEDEEVQHREVPANVVHGEWTSIGNIVGYQACKNAKCI